MKTYPSNKASKYFVILLSNTIIKKYTMMVKTLNTFITFTTMFYLY